VLRLTYDLGKVEGLYGFFLVAKGNSYCCYVLPSVWIVCQAKFLIRTTFFSQKFIYKQLVFLPFACPTSCTFRFYLARNTCTLCFPCNICFAYVPIAESTKRRTSNRLARFQAKQLYPLLKNQGFTIFRTYQDNLWLVAIG